MADDYLGGLKRFSIDGIDLPYTKITIKGGIRKHVHEYPHVPGGLIEKLGRKLYEIKVMLLIDETVQQTGFYQGRNLFKDLDYLMDEFDQQLQLNVYLPNLGSIQAVATDWSRDLDVKLRSGEAVELALMENSEEDYLIDQTRFSDAAAAMGQNLDDLEAVIPTPRPQLLEELRDAVNQLIAFRDTTQMWVGFVAAKVESLQFLFEEVDSTLGYLLDDPLHNELLEAIRALWASVRQVGEGLRLVQEFKKWNTPRDMSTQEISLYLYKDTQHAIDIMQLNALEDPYNVPAGTEIKYIKEKSKLAQTLEI